MFYRQGVHGTTKYAARKTNPRASKFIPPIATLATTSTKQTSAKRANINPPYAVRTASFCPAFCAKANTTSDAAIVNRNSEPPPNG